MPQVREPKGAQGALAVWRGRHGREQQGERSLLRPWSCLSDEPLGGREPPQGGEVKLADSMTKADLLRRVRRIEGQARGIARMIEEDRDCREVLQQLAAVRSAAHQATVALVRAYATECMVSDSPPEEIADALAVALSRLA